MWCNFVDVKHKQGFLEYKHAALNIWKAVLLLDWTGLYLDVDISVDPAGGGPHLTGLFEAALLSLVCLFHRWQNDLFGLNRQFSELNWTAVAWLCCHFYFGFAAWFGAVLCRVAEHRMNSSSFDSTCGV